MIADVLLILMVPVIVFLIINYLYHLTKGED